MQTKKCPYCREEIQYDAIKCRFCDEFLEEDSSKGVVGTIWSGLMGLLDGVGSLLRIALYLIPLALIAMCGYCVLSVSDIPTTDPASSEITQDTVPQSRSEILHSKFGSSSTAHVMFERAIKQTMHDPRSYQFVTSTYQDRGKYIDLTIQYRGKNAFGALVLESLTARFDIDENLIEIIKQ